jgi:integrase/recombinase XerD
MRQIQFLFEIYMAYQYKREPLTPDEANRLTNACQTHEERLIVWTLLDTGLRVAELANLKKDNIDWQGKRLIIFGKGGMYGKQSKRRVVPLSNRASTLIEKHFGLYESIGMTPRTIQRMMKTLANRAEISRPVTPHVLRHSFACAAVQKGISLPALQKILGHDHLSTTQIYLNLSPEDVIREYQQKW